MRPEQQIIVAWMRRQLERLRWNPERWAKEAGLSPTTVSRAMHDKYESVSSVTTLHALARAANMPSILDYLTHQTNSAYTAPLIGAVLAELLPAIGCNPDDELLGKLGVCVSHTLAQVQHGTLDRHENYDIHQARTVARAMRSVFFDSGK